MKTVFWISDDYMPSRAIVDLMGIVDNELTLNQIISTTVRSVEDLENVLREECDIIAFKTMPAEIVEELMNPNNKFSDKRVIRAIGKEKYLPENEKGENPCVFIYDHWETIK